MKTTVKTTGASQNPQRTAAAPVAQTAAKAMCLMMAQAATG